MYVLRQIYAAAVGTPEKPALIYNAQPVSYDRFWRLIDGARRSLRETGLEPGLAVLIVDNILDAWILDLAFRSLGLDTVALESAAHLALLSDRRMSCVVTVEGEPHAAVGAPEGASRLVLSRPSGVAMAEGQPLPPLPAFEAVGGHILLTSGVTGAPKPVMSRAGETDAMLVTAKLADKFVDPRFAQAGAETVFCLFDLGLWTAAGYSMPLLCWCDDATVVIDQRGDYYLALLWPGITQTFVTPFYLSRVLAAPEGSFPYSPAMRAYLWGGGITPDLAREARRRLTPLILNNVGSTEVGVWASTPLDTDEDLVWHKIIPGQRVEVVDEAGQVLPANRLGEVRIALRGAQAPGHLGDAAATGAPFQQGWFYPGDLGVFDERGRLSLRGRSMDVVNIDGIKISVEPWERQLREALGCEGVCIIGGHFDGARDEVHVFIESQAMITPSALVAAVQATVRGYPDAQIHKIEALPRTAMGKVRRVELAQRIQDGAYR